MTHQQNQQVGQKGASGRQFGSTSMPSEMSPQTEQGWRPPGDWQPPDDLTPPDDVIPDDWRCTRLGPVSGRYRGEMTAPDSGRYELVLRVDIDPRQETSPVMDRVSGDIFRKYRFRWRGEVHEWRSYQESWIVEDPSVNWQECYVDIKGSVRFWEGSHPSTRVGIRIPWGTFESAGPADVTLRESGSSTPEEYTCSRESSAFRDLRMEVDVCESVNSDPIVPEYDTHAHATRPSGIPQRTLTIEDAYREEGVDATVVAPDTIIDDSDSDFDSWSMAELHDAMEDHYSRYSGGWPKWHMWGLLAGSYDSPSVLGIMFDVRSRYGGPGKPSYRQGFAIFRDHNSFDDLPNGAPTNPAEAEAMRDYLYTWIHEAGHAFNFLHSWDKGRSGAYSWMNYPQRVPDFWDNFEFRFDDSELVHLRHGDRNAVIMGGDPFGTDTHLQGAHDAATEQLSPVEGNPPVELLVRSRETFGFLEPIEIELRLRNLMDGRPIELDSRLDPAFGNVSVFVRRPDDTVVRYKPIAHLLGTDEPVTLKAADEAVEGEDRYSESVFIDRGADGAYFDEPGRYAIRAAYQDREDFFIVSNTHTVHVSGPQSREEENLAREFFGEDVGLSLYFGGSQSPHLAEGMAVLEDVAERYTNTLAGAAAATAVASSLEEPFFSVRDGTLTKTADADIERALMLTEPAHELYRDRKEKSLNLPYHALVRSRARMLESIGEDEDAREEVATLREDLSNRDVNQPVLDGIEAFEESI